MYSKKTGKCARPRALLLKAAAIVLGVLLTANIPAAVKTAAADDAAPTVTARYGGKTPKRLGDMMGSEEWWQNAKQDPEQESVLKNDDYRVYFSGLTPGALVYLEVNYTSGDARWFNAHLGEAGNFVTVDENGCAAVEGLFPAAGFTRPGKVVIQPSYAYVRSESWPIDGEQIALDPIEFDVLAPTIRTNYDDASTIVKYVGESDTLTSVLDGTGLTSRDTAYFLDPDNYDGYGTEWQMLKWDELGHVPSYLPSIEVISGADLVTCSDVDDSQTLSGSAKLTFRKAGTVKIKLKYTLLNTCGPCIHGENIFQSDIGYDPERILTIRVEERPESGGASGTSSGSTGSESGTSSGATGSESGTSSGAAGSESGTSSGAAGSESGTSSGTTGSESGTSSGAAGSESGTSSSATGSESGTSSGSTASAPGNSDTPATGQASAVFPIATLMAVALAYIVYTLARKRFRTPHSTT